MFDLTFNAVQHASSTVGDLRAAVNAMTSRWPTRMRCNNRDLTNDALSLVEAGIGLQCTLEISFNPVPATSTAASPTSARGGKSAPVSPSPKAATPSRSVGAVYCHLVLPRQLMSDRSLSDRVFTSSLSSRQPYSYSLCSLWSCFCRAAGRGAFPARWLVMRARARYQICRL